MDVSVSFFSNIVDFVQLPFSAKSPKVSIYKYATHLILISPGTLTFISNIVTSCSFLALAITVIAYVCQMNMFCFIRRVSNLFNLHFFKIAAMC